MRIEDALTQVRAIRVQVARTEQFECYRWATVAISGLIAFGAATIQSSWIPHPIGDLDGYLLLWVSVAAVSALTTGSEMLVRWLRTESAYARQQTFSALRQFAPCLLVGATLTLAIRAFGQQHAELLPAVWAACFSLGLFASWQFLPGGTLVIATYYLVTAVACIRFGLGDQALRPWTMALTFGMGQLLTAFFLHRHQEKVDDQTEA